VTPEWSSQNTNFHTCPTARGSVMMSTESSPVFHVAVCDDGGGEPVVAATAVATNHHPTPTTLSTHIQPSSTPPTPTLRTPIDAAQSTLSDVSLSLSITPTHVEDDSSSVPGQDGQRLSPHSSLHHHDATAQPHSSLSIACPTHVDEGSLGQQHLLATCS